MRRNTKLANNVSPIIYKLMVVAATLIWGSSFVVMKDAIDVVEPSWLVGIRFLLTSFLLGAVFWKRLARSLNKQAFISGAVLGALIFGAYWFQTVGLDYTTPGKNAFLTATYCVLVPFISWMVSRTRPTVFNLAAAVLCITGVGFVSLANDSFSMGVGDALTLVCGVLFGAHIVATSVFAKNQDVLVLTIYQFFVSGILGVLVGMLTETPPNASALNFDFIASLLYLVVFASCIAMGFQNIALAHIPPSQVAILLSLESVFGVVFSVVFYGEELSFGLVFGFVLIFISIILSEAFPRQSKTDDAIAKDSLVEQ